MTARTAAPLAAGLLLALAACSGGTAATPSAAEIGPRASRDYPLSGFDRIELKGADSVVVHRGPAFAVRAEAPQGVLDRLELTVVGGVLKVGRRDDDWNWGGSRGVATVTVTLPTLAGAALAGSGDMTVDAAGGGKPFAASVAGSGSLDIAKLEATTAKLDVAGSGDLAIGGGRIGQGDYSIAGSGDLRAADVTADAVRASVAGSGDITAKASGSAAISIVGSGGVTVGGGAKCTVTKVGSGDAKCG